MTLNAEESRRTRASALWSAIAIFFAVGIILFLASSRSADVYDEGLELTAAMRIVAGQVIHRDFYYNYGPAGIYLVAGLFKLFGPSVFVSRMLALVESASTAAAIYLLARRLTSTTLAWAALIASVLWSETLGFMTLFTLWSTWLLLPLFQRKISRATAAGAGLLVGVTGLFRYDIGFGLVAVHLLIMAAAVLARERRPRPLLREATPLGWYVLGYAALTIPLFLTYAAKGVMGAFLYDIVLYPAKYYHTARNLPFPSIHKQNFQDIIVYVLPVLLVAGFLVSARQFWRSRETASRPPLPQWAAALVAYGGVAVVMYVKGLVRISAGPLFMCVGPCLLVAAVLYMHRSELGVATRSAVLLLIALFIAGGIASTYHDLQLERRQGALMLAWLISPATQSPQPPFATWCRQHNALTHPFCYFPDDAHIQAIEYIDANTQPSDTLFVGLAHHDRIYINDNLTYFATQRLPATKWSHFDPFLQNRADIQQEMISEFEQNKPPYVVLDSEFEAVHEPNGSSVSTGVYLLDDYLAGHYIPVQHFGELEILQRRSGGKAQ